jgi:uncharacterized protein (TIGR00251 family)
MNEAPARLRVRVMPGAPREQFVGRYGTAWKVRVSAPPEGGRANEAVLRLLADTASIARSAVTLVSGRGGRDKVVEFSGIDADELDRRLEEATA